MSPALLTKYFDAAKEIAAHAVLLPDGLRFSPATNDGDWTDEILAEIRGIYGQYSPIATARSRSKRISRRTSTNVTPLAAGSKTIAAVAAERKLSPKYLGTLWNIAQRPSAERTRPATASNAATTLAA